jgi:hypothetical protein
MGVLKAARAKSAAGMGELPGHFHDPPLFLLKFCVSRDTVRSTPFGTPSHTGGLRHTHATRCRKHHVWDRKIFWIRPQSGITLEFLRSPVFRGLRAGSRPFSTPC